jgi:hypothetical protein
MVGVKDKEIKDLQMKSKNSKKLILFAGIKMNRRLLFFQKQKRILNVIASQ